MGGDYTEKTQRKIAKDIVRVGRMRDELDGGRYRRAKESENKRYREGMRQTRRTNNRRNGQGHPRLHRWGRRDRSGRCGLGVRVGEHDDCAHGDGNDDRRHCRDSGRDRVRVVCSSVTRETPSPCKPVPSPR